MTVNSYGYSSWKGPASYSYVHQYKEGRTMFLSQSTSSATWMA